MRIAADALSRLAAPPLPEKIAGLIKRADDAAINTDRAEDRKLFANLGDALRALAQEINSLTVENGSLDEELSRKVKRIRALVRENERLNQGWRDANGQALDRGLGAAARIRELEAERDAIRAKTIEECVTSLQKEHDATGSINAQRALKEAIETLRALAQTDESKAESEE
jgi:prefoldin subunit 5